MRILHIFDHSIPLHSGYTFRSQAIINQQRALGWETEHITGPKHDLVAGPTADEEEVDGLHFFRTAPADDFISRLPVLNQWAVIKSLERRLREIVGQVRPDILHAHSPALNGLAAIRAGRRFGIPVVYEVRAFWEDAAVDHGTSSEWGLRYRLTRALETSVLKQADGVTTICEGLRADIVARGISGEKVVVIPNAVDLDKFTFSTDKDESLAGELDLQGRTVLGFIGSFYAYEGLDLLIRAFPSILNYAPEARILLVGGGPEEERLRALAEDTGVTAQVIFCGRVPHDQVQRYYDLVDIFVYPRSPMRLTDLVTPLKPLEAMAKGRLVVASDVGGHRELIRNGETGELFSAGDADALAKVVETLLNTKDTWLQRREVARRYVEEERNWPVSVARYRTLYESLIGTVNRDS